GIDDFCDCRGAGYAASGDPRDVTPGMTMRWMLPTVSVLPACRKNLKRTKKMQIETPAFTSITRAIGCAALLFAAFTAPTRAEEVKAGDLVISQAWSRATPNGA